MLYLLDTNVLSETRKKQADPSVISFLAGAASNSLCLSVLSLGELRRGAALKRESDPEMARQLAAWIDGLESSFYDRILSIDGRAARLWGEWSAQRSRPIVDTLLAATAVVHELTFVTRNTRDVEDIAVRILNPWTYQAPP